MKSGYRMEPDGVPMSRNAGTVRRKPMDQGPGLRNREEKDSTVVKQTINNERDTSWDSSRDTLGRI